VHDSSLATVDYTHRERVLPILRVAQARDARVAVKVDERFGTLERGLRGESRAYAAQPAMSGEPRVLGRRRGTSRVGGGAARSVGDTRRGALPR
jgi:hypothetical protein